MSALEVALTLGVNRDCSRPISPWSINRAKGTFLATASHTSTRWLANNREQGLWVTCHVPQQIRASLDASSPLSSGQTLEAESQGDGVSPGPQLHAQAPFYAPFMVPLRSHAPWLGDQQAYCLMTYG